MHLFAHHTVQHTLSMRLAGWIAAAALAILLVAVAFMLRDGGEK